MASKEDKNGLDTIFLRGILRENPVFVLLLGLCPFLATTTSFFNGLGIGLATTFVLVSTNIVISLMRNFIPDKVRIPAYIIIIAGFVSVVELLVKAFVPALDTSLGIFIPLITVNCIVLGRAEAFASHNTPFKSFLDALGMGIGFTIACVLMGLIREALGAGQIFGIDIPWLSENPFLIFIMPTGGFLVYAMLIVLATLLTKYLDKKKKEHEQAIIDAYLAQQNLDPKSRELIAECSDELHFSCESCSSSGSCGLEEYRHQLKDQRSFKPGIEGEH